MSGKINDKYFERLELVTPFRPETKKAVTRVVATTSRMLYRSPTILNLDRIPTNGKPIIWATTHRKMRDIPNVGILSVAADRMPPASLIKEQLLLLGLGWLFHKMDSVAVNRDEPDERSLQAFVRKLEQGSDGLIFPESTRIRKDVRDVKKTMRGVAIAAMKSECLVAPIGLAGYAEGDGWRHKPVLSVGKLIDPVDFGHYGEEEPLSFNTEEIKPHLRAIGALRAAIRDGMQSALDEAYEYFDEQQAS